MNRQLKYDRDSWWQEFVNRIAPGVRLPADLAIELSKEYWRAYEDASISYSDTMDTLLYLAEKEYVLGIVSDTDGKIGQKAERIGRLRIF